MSNIKVTWEDQQRINAYGRNTSRSREIDAELEELEESLRTYEDASSEMVLADEAPRLRLGDCFIEVDEEEAESFLEARVDEAKARIAALEAEKVTTKATLAELKVELLAKFGDAISLEK
jgi:prefoldin subunit 4